MKKPTFALRLLLGIVSFVLCLCLFVSAIAAIVIADVRTVIDKDNLKKLVNDLMFSPMAARQIPASSPRLATLHHIRLSEPSSQNDEAAGLVVEFVYDFLREQMGEEFDLTYDHVNAFFEESTAKEFLSEKIAAVISDACTGESETSITNEEIADLIRENKDLVQEHFGITLTEEKMQNLTTWVEESGLTQKLSQEGIMTMLGTGAEEPAVTGVASIKHIYDAVTGSAKLHIPTAIEAARFVTSDAVLFSILGICALLIGLLVLTNMTRIHLGLINSGSTLLAAGGIMLIPAAFSSVIAGLLPGTAGKLVLYLLNATVPAGLVTLALAIILIAAGIVLRYVLPKRKTLA